MVFDTAGKNPHHRRLPRDARHVLDQMRRPGLTPYRRAVVLHAQVAALDYAVNRRHRRRMPLPGEVPAVIADGQRVRLGVEVRDLLDRLHASKNVREQQALMREIRHAILRRIVVHTLRSAQLQAGRVRAGQVLAWLNVQAARAGRETACRLRRIRDYWRLADRAAAPVRTVGHREREIRVRVRQPAGGRHRALASGERTGRGRRERPARGRITT